MHSSEILFLSLHFNKVFLALILRNNQSHINLEDFVPFPFLHEISFLNSVKSSVKPSDLGLSVFERFLSIDSICFLVTGLLRCSVSLLFSHGGLCLCLVIVVYMLQLLFFLQVIHCADILYLGGIAVMSLFCFGLYLF